MEKPMEKYNKQTADDHGHSYQYFSDFDFDPFFDTIDHSILCNILTDFGIEKKTLLDY
ncbi:MAG: hypothetical protein IPM82_04105 [Saprospiraceae bacterium]|nr:hypothetical protein [Saprospiraceae bacterium]